MFTSGLGMVSECSRSRVPKPPQKSTTFIGYLLFWKSSRFDGVLPALLLLRAQAVDEPVLRQLDHRVGDRLILRDIALQPAIEGNRHRQSVFALAGLVALDQAVAREPAHAVERLARLEVALGVRDG